MRVLVTGASGFIGHAVLAALVRHQLEVHALSRSKPKVGGKYIWHPVDLLDHAAANAAVRKTRPDIVLHLAWFVRQGFWTAPENLDWVAATLALARSSAEAGVRRFVGAGTCYEYTFPDDKRCDEASTPLKPGTLYGVCKNATRSMLEAFTTEAKMSFAWARIFFLYGPHEAPTRLVSSVARALARGEAASCSSGKLIRDYMDVRDVGEALCTVALSEATGAVNIGAGRANSIAEIVTKLAALAGRPELLRLGAIPDRPNEAPYIVADTQRLHQLGFKEARGLDDGLRDALQYWKEAAR